jgi:hypothetical protein
MKRHLIHIAGSLLVASLAMVPTADGQILGRWFGPKSAEKSTPKTPQLDPRRLAEINVEIAWLADPVTFPYYLEAHASANQIEVKGFVPNKTVREQALRIAQVYSSMPVADSLKEHPSLQVKPSPMSPQQLLASVQASLRVALPRQHQQLKAECGSDGKVFIVGTVNSHEEKLTVSHALRRLHGCTSVQNLTTIPGEKTDIVTASNQKPVTSVETKNKPFRPAGKGQTTDEPPLLDAVKPAPKDKTPKDKSPKPVGPVIVNDKKPEGPILIPREPEVKRDVVKVESPAPAPGPAAPPKSATDLQKQIKAASPQIKGVTVQFTSAKDVQITIELATEKELNAIAERVFAMPELQKLNPELQFKINGP